MEELNDTQSESDDRGIDINWVGVNSFKFPIVFQDKSEERSTIADFQLSVDLANNHRGTHMSRFIEVLNDQCFFMLLLFNDLFKGSIIGIPPQTAASDNR